MTKIRLKLSADEVPDLLARIGEGVAAGKVDLEDVPVPLAGYRKLDLKLRQVSDGVLATLSVKFERDEHLPEEDKAESAAGEEARPGKRPRYSELKEHMKALWGGILRNAADGVLPDAGIAAEFAADCKAMIGFPAKGDDNYRAFGEAVEHFRKALDARDLQAFIDAVAEIDRIRKECHKRYR